MVVLDLGIKDFLETLDIQKDLLCKRINKKTEDTIILVEHLPVITTGRLKGLESILDHNYFKINGIPVVETNRGGSVTFHCPGQLVIYPIIDISERNKNISSFIDLLETTVAAGLDQLGAPAERIQGNRGVWINNKKIAFTGIAFKRWVSYHGVSVNVNNDTIPFKKINPCGMSDIEVGSLKEYFGKEISIEKIKDILVRQFELAFSG